jgi:hypothetical protein
MSILLAHERSRSLSALHREVEQRAPGGTDYSIAVRRVNALL